MVYVIRSHMAVDAASTLLLGTLNAGPLATQFIRRLSPTVVRILIIVLGVTTTCA